MLKRLRCDWTDFFLFGLLLDLGVLGGCSETRSTGVKIENRVSVRQVYRIQFFLSFDLHGNDGGGTRFHWWGRHKHVCLAIEIKSNQIKSQLFTYRPIWIVFISSEENWKCARAWGHLITLCVYVNSDNLYRHFDDTINKWMKRKTYATQWWENIANKFGWRFHSGVKQTRSKKKIGSRK